MRVLVATTANIGHFAPLVSLSRAAADAGHDVRVAAPRSFADTVSEAGLDFAPVDDPTPEDLEAVYRTLPRPGRGMSESHVRDVSNLIMVRDIFGRVDARAALRGMKDLVSSWRPDVIVRELAEVSSLVAAEAAGIRHVQVSIGIVGLLQQAVRVMSEPFEELEESEALESGQLTSAALTAPMLTSIPASFDSYSDAVAAPRTIDRFRETPPISEPRPLPEWGDRTAPLVYVTFGTVAATMPYGELFHTVLDALADSHIRVLFTIGPAGDPESLRPWPENAHIVRWWPQAALMEEAAAVVGHGGFGTTMAALAAGVPQVVLPLFSSDQWLNAARVQAVGAGVFLEPGPTLAESLGPTIRTLIDDPAARRGAESIRDEIHALATPRETIERVLGQHA